MDSFDVSAPADDAEARVTLLVTGHYRLRDKPARTGEALRVFFPRAEADAWLADLQARRPVAVRNGSRAEIGELAMAMRAQGFTIRIEAIDGT